MEKAEAVLEGVTGSHVIPGNEVEVLRNGEQIFPAMLEAIRSAERTVDLLTYVYWTGDIAQEIAHTLAEQARKGLRVRVILDWQGSWAMDNALADEMVEAGCLVERFRESDERPTRLHHRTHRKLLVCDESVAFTGGVGIAEEWEGDARNPEEWRETHFRVTGPAVRPMVSSFIEHWVECGHPSFSDDDHFPDLEPAGSTSLMVLRGSSGPFWHDIGLAMDVLLRGAQDTINLTTAYFAPGERMLGLLAEAVGRGVTVRVLLPGSHMDRRVVQLASADEYEQLLDAGVEVWHYEQTMLHAKIVTVDGHLCLFGSANVDERSMRHNEELAVVGFDTALCDTLDEHFEADLEVSEQIDLERWRDRPAWRKLVEKAVDPIEHWL
ncbi:phospholipase D-like domain-containing protein [Euzebya tangerina]|uniref:phospholipase D-like domain-containing protein n=1 Tax=Euzebya tangerina TaxID=591198 RepID=UPI000E31B0B7|nr:phospholipase D-like domain-containing protein [Euzebya tangerina]